MAETEGNLGKLSSGAENADIPSQLVIALVAVAIAQTFFVIAKQPAFLGLTTPHDAIAQLAAVIFPAVETPYPVHGPAGLFASILSAPFLTGPGFYLLLFWGHSKISRLSTVSNKKSGL